MIIIQNKNTYPYFNIAAEEYLLKNYYEDIFLLYQNDPSIIIGKHQNVVKEINQKYVYEKSLPVIRRLTGGGTVYHDLGNINFTFILNGEKGKLIDFKKYTRPIVDFLQKIEINAVLGERNNIFIDGYKISGNAEHIFKNRVLHHGTLLFNTNLDNLAKSIDTQYSNYIDKSVNSIRSKVTNIENYLKNKIEIGEFSEMLIQSIKNKYNCKTYKLDKTEIETIQNLIKSKYSKWEWNYGYSPEYTLKKSIEMNSNYLNITIHVKKGIIKIVKINGNLIPENIIENINKLCIGIKHDYSEIFHIFSNLDIEKQLLDIILDNMF
ncbi:biotin/lipoate A/B protein ligase family protein [Bacteroidota bacterium]